MAQPDPSGPWTDYAANVPLSGQVAPPWQDYGPVTEQQLPPVLYSTPQPYNGHAEDYVWDRRLPDPGQGMAWPKGTVPDPRANDVGNAATHLPGDPKAFFGRPRWIDPSMWQSDPVSALLHPDPKADVVSDVAQTVPAAGVRGTEALLASPGDLTTLAQKGVAWLGDRAMEFLGPEHGGWSHYHSMLNEHAGGPDAFGGPGYFPTSKDLNQAVAGLLPKGQELYTPKTEAGKIVNSAVELLPSTALGGEGVIGRIAPAVVGGAGGQLAEDAARGTPLEPWARVGGTLVGAGGVGALTQPVTVEKMLAQGGRGLTQEQLDLAQALMAHGEQMGVPLTSAEAVQQVTGGAFPGLTRLQRVAEGTREGSSIYGPAMAERPRQLADALRTTVLDKTAPPTAMPSAIGLDAQQGSQAVLDTAREAVNAQAKPFYDNLGGETVQPSGAGYSHAPQYSGRPGQFIPDERFAPLAAHPAYQEALAQVRGDPMLNAGVEHLPDNDLAVVDRTVKQLDRNARGYAQTAENPSGNNFKAAQASNARAQADELAAAVSPDWRAARDIVKGGHEVLLDPLAAGPIGQMAKTSDVGAQTSALYPRAPLEGAASETVQALRALGRVNEGEFSAIPGDLTRQHLANSWNEASRSTVPDQWVGARWFKNTLGNPEQKLNLLAGVGEVGGPELADALSRFGNVAQATGYRARQGSATAFNMEDLGDLSHGGPVGTVVKGAMNPMSIPHTAADAFTRWRLGQNTTALAKAFIDGSPEERAALLAEALKNQPDSAGGWASKLLLYDNPVIPGRKKEGDSAP